jgi:hypothetical protein
MDNNKSAKKAVKKTVTKKVTKKTVTKKAASHEAEPKKAVKKNVEKAEHEIPGTPGMDTRTEYVSSMEVASATMEAPASRPFSADMSAYWQEQYGDNRIVLMIRDPYWCFAYWDLAPEKQGEIIRELEQSGRKTKLLLRVYDVTDVDFDGSNAHRSMDIEISEEATNWYINVWSSDRSYCVDLGLLFPDGRFVTIVRSNVITTPRDSVSPIIDEEWMVVDETFDQLYHTAGAAEFGRSSEALTKYMLKRVRAEVTSGGLASMGSAGGRPQPAQPEEFWLVVHTELIVYGATEPDAKVTIQGQPLRLNNDGTFSVRYALPDGKQTIPVKAINATGTQERQITPIVEKKTE